MLDFLRIVYLVLAAFVTCLMACLFWEKVQRDNEWKELTTLYKVALTGALAVASVVIGLTFPMWLAYVEYLRAKE